MNTYSFLTRNLAAQAERVFLTTDNGAYRYSDVHRETARIAKLLCAHGLRRGDRVAAQVEKSPQALFLYLACLRAGLCYLPLNIAYQRDELGYFIDDAEPRVIVCSPERESLFCALSKDAIVYTLNTEGEGTLSQTAKSYVDEFDDVELAPGDLAVIIYTSGTTGRAKGAMITHGNLCSNAKTLNAYWEISATDVLVHALPLFHIHGLFVGIHPLMLSGARIIFQRRFAAHAVLDALSAATLLMGVPTFYTRLLQEPALERNSVAHMRLFISGSAPLSNETLNTWRQRTGYTILERYGMSEAGMITSNPCRGERRGGTVGFPLPQVEVRVVDKNQKPLDAGAPGDVEIKGPNVFAGYWRMPDKTLEAFSADGWFKTGDLGQWDAAGYLSIVGRAKDLIISGGYNVYPKEVELAIDTLPGIVESAVIGVKHADLGEAVIAIVVASVGVDEAALIGELKQRIAAYKVPKRIHFIRELPRNTMGKVQKNILRERYDASLFD